MNYFLLQSYRKNRKDSMVILLKCFAIFPFSLVILAKKTVYLQSKLRAIMEKQPPFHPFTAQADEIAERGLVVFDDIRSMPLYNEPYVTDLMTIGLTLSGWVRMECNMQAVTLQAHDLVVFMPSHTLCFSETSADYKAMVIVMSRAFQEEMRLRYPDGYRNTNHYLYRQDISLTNHQFQRIVGMFRLLRDISSEDGSCRTAMLGYLLEVMFMQMEDYRIENGIEPYIPTLREELFYNFYHAVEQHYRESREVHFYADLFHLSPKHFAAVIKQQTNIGALQWINSYVIIQAKFLLRHHRQMTMQEISNHLGFPDQAAFSRYFKTNTGLSPTEYREQN